MQRNQQRQSNYYLHPPNKMSLPFTLVLCFVVGIATADDATTTTPAPASGVTSTSTSTSSESGVVTNAPTTKEAPTSSETSTTLKVVVLNVPTTPAVKPFFLSNEPSPSNKENISSPDTKVNMEPPKEMKASETPVVITPASVGETGATVTAKAAQEAEMKPTTEGKKSTESTPDEKASKDATTAQPREQRQAVAAESTTSGSTEVADDGSSPTVDSATVRIVGTTVNFTAIDIMLKALASSTQNNVPGTGSTPSFPTEKANDMPVTSTSSNIAEKAAETTMTEATTKTAESERPTVSPLIQMMTNTMTSIGESKNAAETTVSTAADTSSAPLVTTITSK